MNKKILAIALCFGSMVSQSHADTKVYKPFTGVYKLTTKDCLDLYGIKPESDQLIVIATPTYFEVYRPIVTYGGQLGVTSLSSHALTVGTPLPENVMGNGQFKETGIYSTESNGSKSYVYTEFDNYKIGDPFDRLRSTSFKCDLNGNFSLSYEEVGVKTATCQLTRVGGLDKLPTAIPASFILRDSSYQEINLP